MFQGIQLVLEGAEKNARDVLVGQDRSHAGDLFRLRGIDVQKERMSMGAAQDLHPKHVGKDNIGSKLGHPGHLVNPIDRSNSLADGGKGTFHQVFPPRRLAASSTAFIIEE